MKTSPAFYNFLKLRALATMCAALALGLVPNSARAAAGAQWTGASSATWTTAGNWGDASSYGYTTPANTYPGNTTTSGNTDTAIFNAASANTSISRAGSLYLGNILFDTANCAAYTITISSSGNLRFNGTGTGNITMNSSVANSQVIASSVGKCIRAYPAVGLSIINNGSSSSATLTISAPICCNNSSGTATLTLGGANTGANTISGVIGDYDTSGSYKVAVTKSDAGTWTLNAAEVYSGNTTISAGTLALGSSFSITPAYSSASPTLSIAAGATLDVSGLGTSSTYTLNSQTALSATGNSSASATIVGGSSGTVSLGSQPVTLTIADTTHPALVVAQGALTVNGNALTVINNGAALGAGTYALISVTGGTINNSATPTLVGNSVGGSGVQSGLVASISVSGGNVNLVVAAGFGITSATANPSTITRENSTTFSVTVMNGTPNYSVKVDYSLLKGDAANTDTQTLSGSGPTFNFSAVTPVNSLAVGTYNLPVTASDSAAGTANGTISVTVTTNLTWSGAGSDQNWSTAANWAPSGPPLSSESASFGSAGTSGDSGTVNNVVGASTTIAALTYNHVVSGTYHVTQIESPHKLTVSGAVTVGSSVGVDGQVTAAYFTGTGSFEADGPTFTVDNPGSSANSSVATLDLSGLANFTYNNSSGSIILGQNGSQTRGCGVLTLAGTANNITAGSMMLNNSSGNASSSTSYLNLNGANNIYVGGFCVSSNKGGPSTVRFLPGAPTSSTLKLRNTDGSSRANLFLGVRNNTGTGTTTGTMNLDGGYSVDIQADTLLVGGDVSGSTSATHGGVGVLQFDTGTVDATTVTMAACTTADPGSPSATGTITVGANATLVAGTGGISLANQVHGTATGTLNISGGTARCNGSITKASTSGTGNITFNGGGSLQLAAACYVGSASVPIDTFTLDNNTTLQFVVPSDGTVNAVVGTLNWPADDTTLAIHIAGLPDSATTGSTYDLFQYTTFNGSVSAPVVNLPVGYTGHLVNSSPYVQLVIDTAPSAIRPTIPPGITNFSLAGANVLLSGTNGQPGRTYYLLSSTNVAQPLSKWVAVATNVLGAANFTFVGTNAVLPNVPQRFYILSSTNNN